MLRTSQNALLRKSTPVDAKPLNPKLLLLQPSSGFFHKPFDTGPKGKVP